MSNAAQKNGLFLRRQDVDAEPDPDPDPDPEPDPDPDPDPEPVTEPDPDPDPEPEPVTEPDPDPEPEPDPEPDPDPDTDPEPDPDTDPDTDPGVFRRVPFVASRVYTGGGCALSGCACFRKPVLARRDTMVGYSTSVLRGPSFFVTLAFGATLITSCTRAGRPARGVQAIAETSPQLRILGNRPGGFLPANAIDTQDVPAMVLDPEAATEPLPVYQIGRDTYLFFGTIGRVDENNRGFNGNAGFVVTEDGVLVIDALGTPYLGQRMIATIRRVTPKPIKVLVVTHHHPDHYYGAAAFAAIGGVAIIAHPGTLHYVNSDTMHRSVGHRRSMLGGDMVGFRPVTPSVTVGPAAYAKHAVRLGGRTFDIYSVGAHHSKGDLVVHQVQDDIVWISDLAFNQRLTFMGDGSSQKAILAQDWLLERFSTVKLMVPGHGSAQTAPFSMVAATRSYMHRLREAMARAVKNDVAIGEALLQAELPDWQDVRLYETNHRANASFVYREMQWELF